jgi:hypothetical protein
VAAQLGPCRECGEEIDITTGLELCEVCEYGDDVAAMEDEWAHVTDEPVWYTLSEVIHSTTLPERPWQELMALAQILHDLRINDTNKLMRRLGAVYVADEGKPLQGEYHYFGAEQDPDRFYGEVGTGNPPKEAKKKEPVLSNRRRAIMAQKEKKNEGS